MNLYLIQFVGNLLSLLVVSIASFFGSVSVETNLTSLTNENSTKNLSVTNIVVPYETEYQYDSSIPSNVTKVLTEGVNGVNYIDENGEEKTLSDSTTEVILVGTGDNGEYIGRSTGYGPDCVGCSAVGNVACFTKNRTKHSLINDGITYQDEEYGEVRILAADTSKFPCGTIVLVDTGKSDAFYGVVLDSGYSMRQAWRENGTVWMDVAFASSKDAINGNVTSYHTSYSVQRWGW